MFTSMSRNALGKKSVWLSNFSRWLRCWVWPTCNARKWLEHRLDACAICHTASIRSHLACLSCFLYLSLTVASCSDKRIWSMERSIMASCSILSMQICSQGSLIWCIGHTTRTLAQVCPLCASTSGSTPSYSTSAARESSKPYDLSTSSKRTVRTT